MNGKTYNMFVAMRRWYKDIKHDVQAYGWFGAIYKELIYYPPLKWCDASYYWIRYRTWKKFHIVKMPTLKPGYCDIDTRLLHANFSLLVEYVEKEKPFDCIEWDHDETYKHIGHEIKELYAWWKHIYSRYEELVPLNDPGVECPGFKTKIVKYDPDGDPALYELLPAEDTPENKKWHDACMKSREYEIHCDKTIEENLIRLIKIRKYLWT